MSVKPYTLTNGETRWLFVIDLPRQPGTARKQLKRRRFITEAVARKAEEAERKRLAKYAPASRGTVAAELRKYVDTRKPDLAHSTWSNYKYVYETYVIPFIGTMPVTRASEPRVIAELYETIKARGGKRGQGLTAGTVHTVHRTLMVALRDLGVDVSGIRSPRSRAMRGKRRQSAIPRGRRGIWDAEQCLTFLRYCSDTNDHLFALWVLAIVCGLRRGELAGLRWRYVDLEKGILYVRRQRVTAGWVEGSVYEDEPKAGSERDIPLGDFLLPVMRRQLAKCEAERTRRGDAYRGEDFVFLTNRGRPYHPTNITHRFVRLMERAGLPRIALHDLRHTSASIGGGIGVDLKALQHRLGHARADTLTNIYMHPLPAAAYAATNALEGALLGPL